MGLITAVLVVGLVSYRVWRMIVWDTVFERLRPWDDPPEFWSCPWCSGFWITGLITLIAWQTGLTSDPLWVWPAASVVCGWLGSTT